MAVFLKTFSIEYFLIVNCIWDLVLCFTLKYRYTKENKMKREIKHMNEKWQNKIEQDIKELAVSITKLASSLDSFIKSSQEIQEGKFDQI